jgi:hypothetical protein
VCVCLYVCVVGWLFVCLVLFVYLVFCVFIYFFIYLSKTISHFHYVIICQLREKLDKQEKDENSAIFNDEKGSISVFGGAKSCLKITDSEVKSSQQENFTNFGGQETVIENGENSNTVSASTVHLSIPYDGIISIKNRKNSKNGHSQGTKVRDDSVNIGGNDGHSCSSESEKVKSSNSHNNNNSNNNNNSINSSNIYDDIDENEDVEVIDIDIDSDKDDINIDNNSDNNSQKKKEKDDSNSLWLPLTALSVLKSAYVPQNLKSALKLSLAEGEVQGDNEKVQTFFWNRFSQKIQVVHVIK